MPLKIAVQMDHISTVNITGDTTFALCLEAQARGHELFHVTPDRLSLDNGKVVARLEPLQVRDVKGDHYSLGAPVLTDMSDMNVVLLRQDPPFDMFYVTTTHLLQRIHPKTLVVNDPFEVRNAPEKLFVTEFPELMPPTLISKDRALIDAFRTKHGDIIVKPLYGNGGAGVFLLHRDDKNLASLLEMFAHANREPLVIQAYLPAVRALRCTWQLAHQSAKGLLHFHHLLAIGIQIGSLERFLLKVFLECYLFRFDFGQRQL